MKLLLIVLVFMHSAAITQITRKEANAAASLAKIGEKLSALRSVRYQIDRRIQYIGENYTARSGGTIYLEFSSEQIKAPLRFRLTEGEHTVVYNGKHYFILDSVKKEIDLNTKPGNEVLNSSSALYNSLFTLRNAIPELLSSSRTEFFQFDTSINNSRYKAITIVLKNRYIGNTGKLEEFTKDYIGDTLKPYLLIVDPRTLLPYRFVTLYNEKDRKNDQVSVSYLSIEENPASIDENVWYYSSFQNKYSSKKPRVEVNNEGKSLPAVNLFQYNMTETKKNLSILPGKPMVIEFWIKNCDYCMLAFPKMQRLTNQFGKDIEFLSVNTEDSIEDIEFFYNKHKPSYKMLYEGRAFAELLQITSFPTILIVDKKGVIVYSGWMDEQKIEKEIGLLLQK